MTEYASLDDVTAGSPDDDAEDLTLASGKVVRVRGLTRAEHLWCGKGSDSSEIEARMLSKGMVAPTMTVEQAKTFQRKSRTARVSEISDRIAELSGLGEGAAKSDPGADGDD